MELILGCKNQQEPKRTQDFLNDLIVVWPESNEFARAYDLLSMHRLSSGLSIPDCLVAAMALERSLRLYTFNVKHYKVISGLDAEMPYTRARR